MFDLGLTPSDDTTFLPLPIPNTTTTTPITPIHTPTRPIGTQPPNPNANHHITPPNNNLPTTDMSITTDPSRDLLDDDDDLASQTSSDHLNMQAHTQAHTQTPNHHHHHKRTRDAASLSSTPSPPPSTSGHFLLPESLMKNLPSLPSLTPLCFKPSSLSSDLHSISHSQLPSIPSLLPPHTTTSIQPKIPIPIHSSHATAASNPAPSTMVEQTSSATIPLEWTLHNHMATTFTSISSHPYHQQLSMPSVGPAAVLPAPTSFFPRQTFMHTNPTAHYTSPQTHQHLTRPLCLIGPPYSPFAPTREKLNSQPSSKPLQKLPPLHSSH